MGDQESEVDPYFAKHMGKSYEETKEAIVSYLELYLNPDIMSNIVFVDSSFFFEDTELSEYRYAPSYQGFEKIDAPEAGKIIINVSFIQNESQEIKTMLHTILLFCMIFSYLREHPNDRRFIKGDNILRRGTIHEFTSCFFWEMFQRSTAGKVRIIYIPIDLHAIYNSEDVSPQDIEIVKRKDDLIVIHSRKYSFVVKHNYQPDEYDGLPQNRLESMISKWNIDTVIKEYKKGTKKWLNDQVFASTLEWADDGFVYALHEGTDDLVDAFAKRNIKLIRSFLMSDEPRFKGEYYSDLFDKNEEDIAKWALQRNNKMLDNAYLWKVDKISIRHLLVIVSAHRFDLLLQIPTEKIDIAKDPNYRQLSDLFVLPIHALIEKNKENMLEEIFIRYWPLMKKSLREEDIASIVKKTVIVDIRDEAIVYKIIKKIDPSAIDTWLRSIKPPTFQNRYLPSDWEYIIRDDVYKDLENANPISDEDILIALANLKNMLINNTKQYTKQYNIKGPIEVDVKKSVKNLRINKKLKDRMLEIYK